MSSTPFGKTLRYLTLLNSITFYSLSINENKKYLFNYKKFKLKLKKPIQIGCNFKNLDLAGTRNGGGNYFTIDSSRNVNSIYISYTMHGNILFMYYRYGIW